MFFNMFSSHFSGIYRGKLLPEKRCACPICFFWFCCTWTIVWWVENLSFWKAFVFSCWHMPENLNIKSDGNQQLENVQSALCWNAHLSEYRRSLAPTKVVWDNKRVCFESSECFFLMCKVLNWLFWNQVSCFSVKTDVAEWEQNIDQPAFLTVLNHHAPDLLVLTVPFCVDGHLS